MKLPRIHYYFVNFQVLQKCVHVFALFSQSEHIFKKLLVHVLISKSYNVSWGVQIIKLSCISVKLKTLNNNEIKFRNLCLHRPYLKYVSLSLSYSQVQRNNTYIDFFFHLSFPSSCTCGYGSWMDTWTKYDQKLMEQVLMVEWIAIVFPVLFLNFMLWSFILYNMILLHVTFFLQ